MENVIPLSDKQVKDMRTQVQKSNEEKRLEACRKRLDKIISTKVRTSFVGAIAQFEEKFGFLWGRDKQQQDRTQEENQMFELWEQVRIAVFNNGNNQLRAAQNEIANHVVNWNRYRTEFIIRDNLQEK